MPLKISIKYALVTFAFLFTLNSCDAQRKGRTTKGKEVVETQKRGTSYNITLEMDGRTDSMVLMGNYWGDRMVPFDTAYYNSKKKNWVFSGDKEAPRGIYFFLFDQSILVEFIMNDNKEFILRGDTSEKYIGNLYFEGSPENSRYADYKRSALISGEKIQDLGKKISAATGAEKKQLTEERKKAFDARISYMKEFIAKNPNDIFSTFIQGTKPIDVPPIKKANGDIDTQAQYYYYKDHYWDNFNFKENALVRTPEKFIYNKITNFFRNILPQHPDTAIKYADILLTKTKGAKELDKYFIFKITQLYDTMQLMCMDKVFVHMVDNYYLSDRAFWTDSSTRARMKEGADKRRYTTCGATALDLNYYDLDSVPQRLYDHRGSKYTIIVFYDPTCGHCKKELPIVHELYSRKKNDGWSVYAISSMDKKKEWKKYINVDNPTWKDWINVCDVVPYRIWVDNRKKYNIYANPTILILNSMGEVIAKKIPASNIEPFLKQYEKIFKGRK